MKQCILIIEDDPELSELVEFFLQEEGYSTSVVNDGGLAFPKIIEMQPSMVILDMHLPNVSGMEILSLIRGDERVEQTKVLVTTADSKMAQSARPMADVILNKPFNADDLVHEVQRLNVS
ncbi:MAG: response regulator [Anaerolineae bacterium]